MPYYNLQFHRYLFYRLELMCERAEQRSQELEKSYELLDWWKKQGDDLLFSMIPKSIAHLLQNETSYLSTCTVTI